MRAIRAFSELFVVALVLLGSSSCGEATGSHIRGYCATFADAIGLYVDNPVTQMGSAIGTVDKITPNADSVQVDFSVTDSRPLPDNVKAVIRSTSILADRALELVGNYKSGPRLQPGNCVPRDRTATPTSLSQTIGALNNFIKGINPQDSNNIGDTLSLLNQATGENGAGINQILTASSRLLESPDQPISDLKSIVTNTATLTDMLVKMRDPIKQILNDAVVTSPYALDALIGSDNVVGPELITLVRMVSDLGTHAGDETQLTLDALSDVLRINSPHTLGWISALGGILKSTPWWINTVANHYNNTTYFPMHYRPPLYRIRTPNGAVVCNIMNFSNPGSCANVAGQPYGVDINLLQYVFMEASR